MKLRNKKTGEIGNLVLNINPNRESFSVVSTEDGDTICGNLVLADYATLAELNEEWEDYEEPKGIKSVGNIGSSVHIEFETEEEAYKALEKLKAYKRLKDNGFRFACYTRRSDSAMLPEVKALKNLIDITAYLPKDKIEEMESDLEFLFGGEDA